MSGQDIADGDVTHETSIPKLCSVERGFLEVLVGTLRGKKKVFQIKYCISHSFFVLHKANEYIRDSWEFLKLIETWHSFFRTPIHISKNVFFRIPVWEMLHHHSRICFRKFTRFDLRGRVMDKFWWVRETRDERKVRERLRGCWRGPGKLKDCPDVQTTGSGRAREQGTVLVLCSGFPSAHPRPPDSVTLTLP